MVLRLRLAAFCSVWSLLLESMWFGLSCRGRSEMRESERVKAIRQMIAEDQERRRKIMRKILEEWGFIDLKDSDVDKHIDIAQEFFDKLEAEE